MPNDTLENPAQILQRTARARTIDLLGQAAHHFNIEIPEPSVNFNLRGKAAGQARILARHTYEIRYNLTFLLRYPEDFLARTVPHESAHVVVFRLHGPRTRPHGHEWKTIMRLLGADPVRCHSYEIEGVQSRRLKRYPYRCACRSHQLTSIRHNRIRCGQVYLCCYCGTPLVLVSGSVML